MAGKGDKQRPTDKKKFDAGWDRIFTVKPANTGNNANSSDSYPDSTLKAVEPKLKRNG